jgi:hypothetical protein
MRRTSPGTARNHGRMGVGGVICGLSVALAGFGASGCKQESAPPATVPRAELGTPSAVYTVRGSVEAMPDPASPMSAFEVKHEAIDNFVDSEGEVVGMGAMVMPFPLAEGVSVADLRKGDVVEVTFAVWWKPRRHWEATRIEKLPPETPLEFREAKPPRDDESAEPPMPAPEEKPAATGEVGGGE